MKQNALIDGFGHPSLLADREGQTERLRSRGGALVIVPGPLTLVLQKVTTKYPWGDDFAYLLMPGPSPSNLDGNNALDQEEVTNITSTNETKIIEKVFVFADLEHYWLLPPKGGLVRAVAQAGVARTGDTDGDVYLTKIVFSLGYVNTSGSFTSKSSATAATNFHTNSTDYKLCSGQAWVDWDFDIPSNCKLAEKVELYGKIASTESGKMKLCLSRGSHDSYLEF